MMAWKTTFLTFPFGYAGNLVTLQVLCLLGSFFVSRKLGGFVLLMTLNLRGVCLFSAKLHVFDVRCP